jgi:hypothetical protein
MAFQKRPLRRSQLVSPWGVGAIVPFPNEESLMIAGLDMWQFGGDKSDFIVDDDRLRKRLGVNELRLPPDLRDKSEDKINCYIKIPAVRFPRWQYCPFCGTMTKTTLYADKQSCNGYEWAHGRSCSGRSYKAKLIPERFIVVCPEGHVDDFPIMEWIHNNPKNPKEITNKCRIRRSTGGVSASLSGVFYECSCGAKRSMAGATRPGALEKIGYQCKAGKPWLGVDEDLDNPCGRVDVKVVQRGGTNVWFADIVSSIFIPDEEVELTREMVKFIESIIDFVNASLNDGELDEKIIRKLGRSKGFEEENFLKAVVKRVKKMNGIDDAVNEISEEEYRYHEYKMLKRTSGNDELDFHSINRPIQDYNPILHSDFESISLVHRLKETRAFYGFSRLEPSVEQNTKSKKSMLSVNNVNWLPAIEVFGEGIFIEFNTEKLLQWSAKRAVLDRVNLIENSLSSKDQVVKKINPIYVMIHTFSHLLINQLSYESGYGSSSIRERIYCNFQNIEHEMNGVLLYTASGDSDGSLGGLVRQALPNRIEDTIIAAIRNSKWCSSDPICIQSKGQGPDSLNLAACHNCALLPETCCENGNRILDRGLVVGKADDKSIGYFEDSHYVHY